MWGRSKEKKEKKVYVETCPQCGSRDINHKLGISPYVFMGLVWVYDCPKCGYRGINVHLSELRPEEPSTGPNGQGD